MSAPRVVKGKDLLFNDGPQSFSKHFIEPVGDEQDAESVIREMTRVANQYGAINLAQGFPDFPAPAEIKRAAQDAVAADINQYAITWGAKELRDAIARPTFRI